MHDQSTLLSPLCEQCGAPVRRVSPSHRAKGRGRFCSRACFALARWGDVKRRFWSKVRKGPHCWEWTAARDGHGYGQIWFNGRLDKAPRVAWQLTIGPIPPRTMVRHFICDNPPCVRPEHLRLGDQVANMKDAASRGRNGRQRHPERYPSGERVGTSKLTAEAVRSIRAAYRPGVVGCKRLAKLHGVSERAVQMIVNGQTWKNVV